jgi:glycosyltransferase involved in cell wall biosynthesis
MNSSKILYIFGSGRKEKIRTNNYDSSEFFYGYFYMQSKFNNIDSIEMLPNDEDINGSRKILNFVDKVIRKLTNLPFFTHLMLSKKNFRKIKESEIIISTNDRLAISALPMIMLSRFRASKKKLLVIVMGLFSKKRDTKIVYYFQKIFLILILKQIDNLIFLGMGEYKLAIKMYPKFKEKFKFIPFGINLDFWQPSKNYTEESNDYILFVGNDGNRDMDKVIEIANSLKNINVKIITSYKISAEQINKNIEVIYGNWHSSALTDESLKSYYENSILTFIPLKETFQPSGQSVTLQSMSLGIPVVITKTNGFWDSDKFKHLENIIFMKDNNLDSWSNNLRSLVQDKKLLNKISRNSVNTVHKNYDQKDFFTEMEKLI